jgi:hypothetical protein
MTEKKKLAVKKVVKKWITVPPTPKNAWKETPRQKPGRRKSVFNKTF